jgi:4-hydroxybenzoate polyprenyltransferase
MQETQPIEQQDKWRALIEIMRFDKPIGTYLLLAPTLWGLVIASGGIPEPRLLAIFIAGAVVMRAAGCTVNDFADRRLDGHVERTRLRPLVTGALSPQESLMLLAVLLAMGFALVLMTNPLTVWLSIIGAGLALIYPFMKRVTHLPQFVLGAAFSWSIPMAFAAAQNSLPVGLWWLFAANLAWTVAYDTQYAMVDREDDLSVGIKSTAILFGDSDRRVIGLLQALTIFAFLGCANAFSLGWVFLVSVAGVTAMFVWHQWLIKDRTWIGLIILLGLLGDYALLNTA